MWKLILPYGTRQCQTGCPPTLIYSPPLSTIRANREQFLGLCFYYPNPLYSEQFLPYPICRGVGLSATTYNELQVSKAQLFHLSCNTILPRLGTICYYVTAVTGAA